MSFSRGHISRDVALLEILRFTGEPGVEGEAPEVGISGRGLQGPAQKDPGDVGYCTMKTKPKKSFVFPACAWISPKFYFRLGRSLLLEQRLWLFSRDSQPTVARQTLNLLIRSYK